MNFDYDIYSLESYDYDLPKERIAQSPSEQRDHSRLLVVDRKSGEMKDEQYFHNIISYLQPGDVLVRNNTKVIPARLIGTKEKMGLLVLVVVLLFVSNLTVFQQIQLIFESQKVSEITNNMTKNNIFATFECVDRDLLPSDYTYSSYYDTGAEINLETVSKIKDTDHVLNVYPYYQLDSTD